LKITLMQYKFPGMIWIYLSERAGTFAIWRSVNPNNQYNKRKE
jgi:hypothetical protein